jgi:hypothetical protein
MAKENLKRPEQAVSPKWWAVAWSGIGASVLFLVVQTLLVWSVMGVSPWVPPRTIAALVYGPSVLMAQTFNLLYVVTAVIIHFIIGIILTGILASILLYLRMPASLLLGAVYGALLYGVMFYWVTALFPWFIPYRDWVSCLSYVLFGLAAALTYKTVDARYFGRPDAFTRRKS